MAAPTLAQGAASGASAGAALGTVVPVLGNAVGAAIGSIAGALAAVFANNDNGVISARDKIVKKFRNNCAGGASASLFPIKAESKGQSGVRGMLFKKYNLEHSQSLIVRLRVTTINTGKVLLNLVLNCFG